MKIFTQYISEKLRITKDGTLAKKYFPHTSSDLADIIREKYNESKEKINVSDIDTSKVNSFSAVFCNLSDLKEIIGLDTWDVSNADIFSMMFYECTSLTSLYVPHWNLAKAYNLSKMFSGCSKLKSIAGIETWNIPHEDSDHCLYCGEMFKGCKSLHDLDLSGWNTRRISNAYGMFRECESLTKLDLTKWNLRGVTNAGEMFKDCIKLKTLGDIKDWNIVPFCTDNMFDGCYSLESIGDISKWAVRALQSSCEMFNDCKNLILDVSSWELPHYNKHKNMFAGVDKTKFKKCRLTVKK